MASELSKLIDDELSRQGAGDRSPEDTESLLKKKRREALETEVIQERKKSNFCTMRLWLGALLCVGLLLLISVWITGRQGSSGSGGTISHPDEMFGAAGGDEYYYDYGYGEDRWQDESLAYYDGDYEDVDNMGIDYEDGR
uniref:Uncharacterized protein n=1 Tax=Tetraselmis sp. GSL018 TaxID=582737 RepID=A0A061QPA8_9CHLO